MICIGPCCIPVSALFPLVLLLLSPILRLLRKTPLAKYLPDPSTKASGRGGSSGACCSSSSCNDGDNGEEGDVTTVKSLQHWESLKRLDSLVIVDFTAGWCKPCQKMSPIFEGLAAENKDAAVFVKVDIDDLPEAFDGMSIPAFHAMRQGKTVDSFTGAAEDKLRKMVADLCKKTN